VYSLGAICLVLGIALGALLHGPVQRAAADPSVASAPAMPGNPAHMAGGVGQMPAPAAAPDSVIAKVKSDPNNFDLLSQAGNASMKASDPKSAADYYRRALKVKDDADVRINLANAYFRTGDADQSLAELATVLKTDPKNEKALYNTGAVRLMGKRDAKGAIASWETFLKYYPNHPQKAHVQEMIKRAKEFVAQARG
jgi:tetratricopeptide (TPR) repeat protein